MVVKRFRFFVKIRFGMQVLWVFFGTFLINVFHLEFWIFFIWDVKEIRVWVRSFLLIFKMIFQGFRFLQFWEWEGSFFFFNLHNFLYDYFFYNLNFLDNLYLFDNFNFLDDFYLFDNFNFLDDFYLFDNFNYPFNLNQYFNNGFNLTLNLLNLISLSRSPSLRRIRLFELSQENFVVLKWYLLFSLINLYLLIPVLYLPLKPLYLLLKSFHILLVLCLELRLDLIVLDLQKLICL